MEGFLEMSLKFKFALISAQKLLLSIENYLNLTIFLQWYMRKKAYTANADQNWQGRESSGTVVECLTPD